MRKVILLCCLAGSLLVATVNSQQPDSAAPPKGKGFGGRGGKGGGGFAPAPEQPAFAAPRRWEYGVYTYADILGKGDDDFDAGLNKLGDEGWELVSIDFGVISAPGSFKSSTRSRRSTFYFKRPKIGLARERGSLSRTESDRTPREAIMAAAARENPTIVKLKYAHAMRLAQMLQTTFSRSNLVRAVPDERTNSLVIMAPPEQLSQVRELITQLDQPTPLDATQKK